MSVALPEDVQPFRLKRKAEVYHPREKYPPGRAVAAVEYVGRKPAQCIRVAAPDHLYVTDDFIVTHNTVQVLALLEARRERREAANRNGNGSPGTNNLPENSGSSDGNGQVAPAAPSEPAAAAAPSGNGHG